MADMGHGTGHVADIGHGTAGLAGMSVHVAAAISDVTAIGRLYQ